MSPLVGPSLALVSLVLSSTVSAWTSVPPTLCDVSEVILDTKNYPNLSIPANVKPNFVSLGLGTQNYTCQNGQWMHDGTIAELIDISCLVQLDVFPQLRKRNAPFPDNDAVWDHEASVRRLLGPEALVLGQIYDTRAANGTLMAKYDFTSNLYKNDSSKYVTTYGIGSAAAPNASDIEWWKSGRVSGDLADYVYTVDTYSGQPPASCASGAAPIQARYSAKYYFYKDPSSPSYSAGNAAGAINDAAVSGNVDPSTIQKLLDYVPAVLGLLAVTTLLSLVLVIMSVFSMCKRRRLSGPTRSAAYRPVQLPRAKVPEEGSYHDDLEPYGA